MSVRVLLSILTVTLILSFETGQVVHGQDKAAKRLPRREVSLDIISKDDWRKIENSVDNGINYLVKQQRPDGSFQPIAQNEPGISALCVMAMLSRGHLPGEGPYGDKLTKAVNYLISCQHEDGLIARDRQPYHSPYSHGISALVLSELYGMSRGASDNRLEKVIEKAITFTSHRYSQPKTFPEDEGSWRYLRRHRQTGDGDMSVTSWQVMFLRSAKNSGFQVDARLIEEALAYMKRNYDPSWKTFRYEIHTDEPNFNHPRGMAGAGVLSMSLSGEHFSIQAVSAADYVLKRPFDQYARPIQGENYLCYAAFYCSQAMFHMGGNYWSEFYPQTAKSIMQAQRSDGSWIMAHGHEAQYGVPYATALTILALTPPYQMLPIFQR